MKAISTTIIDGIEIVWSVGRPVENPEGSKRRARERLGPDATYHEIIMEMHKRPEYFNTIPGQCNVSDEEGEELEDKLRQLRDNERLTRAGEVVMDNRGREWFSFCGDMWQRGIIKTIGEALPDGAVWARDLSRDQAREIKDQEDCELVSRMSRESRQRAADAEIQKAKERAVMMRLEAEITEETEALDHARRYYQTELSRILQRYGLPHLGKIAHEH